LILEIFKVQKDWSQSRRKSKEIDIKIREIKRRNQLASANVVANSQDIDYVEYEQLLVKHSLTDEERNQINKYILRQRYGIEVTPLLKLRDEKGYYHQLLTHYYLTHESEFLRLRDKQEWHQQLSWGEGKVFLPDLKTNTLKVEALRALGMLKFLEPEREFTDNDADLLLLKNITFQCSKHIKRAIGINFLQEKDYISPIKILNRLLNLLGLKLKRVSRAVYQIDIKMLDDGREEIFAVWQQRDELMLANVQGVVDDSSLWKDEDIRTKPGKTSYVLLTR
jgi:hypothetical protein